MMQLVVEISEDTFFDLKKKQNRTEVDNAVLNGTPLYLAKKKFCEEHINDFRTEESEAENEKRVKA